jgi:N6-adenosine-specific RNA methylase IME4
LPAPWDVGRPGPLWNNMTGSRPTLARPATLAAFILLISAFALPVGAEPLAHGCDGHGSDTCTESTLRPISVVDLGTPWTVACSQQACAPYRTIMADPPWPYGNPCAVVGNGGRGGEGAADIVQADVTAHYDTMSLADIKALPVQAMTDASGSHLYLWTTNSFMVEAHEVARAWGFEPKTILTWGKIRKADREFFEPSCKTGYWYRSATEHCLFAVQGKQRLIVPEALPTLFLEERLPHSVKPESFRAMVEKASPGPYLELFARRAAPGWDVWGNQAPGSIRLEPQDLNNGVS